MLSQIIKSRNNKIIIKISKIINKTKINPNYITLSATIFAAIAAYYIIYGNFIYAIAFMFIAGFIDIIDGSVARIQKKDSLFGNYLDAMIDKYVEIIIYSGFAIAGYTLPAFFAITGSLIISYAKPRLAIVIPIDNHDWPAIGERADRYIILLLGIIISIFNPVIYNHNTINITLWFIALITNIGALQRMKYAKELIEKYRSKK